jgi:hypothetical protein
MIEDGPAPQTIISCLRILVQPKQLLGTTATFGCMEGSWFGFGLPPNQILSSRAWARVEQSSPRAPVNIMYAGDVDVKMSLFQPGEKVEDVSRTLSTCKNYSTQK